MVIAKYLETHPKVGQVNYPGLSNHSSHQVASSQMSKFGSMLSFELKGGFDAGKGLMDNVKLITLAPTLGDLDTLMLHPASSSHLNIQKEIRESVGITDGLVRMSVGIEEPEDLIKDLSAALDTIS